MTSSQQQRSSSAMTTEASGVLLLDNVDDYLAPSQACINPLFQAPKTTNPSNSIKENDNSSTAVVIPRRKRRPIRIIGGNDSHDNSSSSNGTIYVPPLPMTTTTTKKKDDLIQASMADCLACSGCVTTAETVLLEQEHSLDSLRKKCNIITTNDDDDSKHHFIRALTISPSSWADLFRQLGVAMPSANAQDHTHVVLVVESLQRQIVTLMHQIIQVTLVINGTLPLQWSLEESAKEFCEVYRQNQQRQQRHGNRNTILEIPPPSIPIDATRTRYYPPDCQDVNGIVYQNVDKPFVENTQLPLISGACPAVVCLIEKSKHALVTQLATSKSPMALTGAMLHQMATVATTSSSSPAASITENGPTHHDDSYHYEYDHWAIMPCHDKKLEASRKDFVQPRTTTMPTTTSNTNTTKKDIELVITTKEWYQLIRDYVGTQLPQQQDETAEVTTATSRDILTYIQSLPLAKIVYDHLPLPQTLRTDEIVSLPMFATTSPTVSAILPASRSPLPTLVPPSVGTTVPPIVPLASGGHADFIFRSAARELFQCELDDNVAIWHPVVASTTTVYGSNNASGVSNDNIRANGVTSARVANRQRKTTDYYQAILYRHLQEHADQSPCYYYTTNESASSNPEPVLKFAIANGLQTLNRVFASLTAAKGGGSDIADASNLKSTMFDYVEAMACPSGCINGGGQLRLGSVVDKDIPQSSSSFSSTTRETPTQTRQRVSSTQDWLEVTTMSTLRNQPFNGGERSSLVVAPTTTTTTPTMVLHQHQKRTRYHVVPLMKHTMGAAEGVAVQDIQW